MGSHGWAHTSHGRPGFDFIPYIEPSHLTKLILYNDLPTSHLHIRIRLARFTSIKELCVSEHSLNIDGLKQKLKPIILPLSKVEFYNDGHSCFLQYLNDVFNFNNAEEIIIRENNISYSILIYNCSIDTLNAKEVRFDGVQIIKWEQSNGTVELLELNKAFVICREPINMQIKKFVFGTDEIHIDLSQLHDCIEELTVNCKNDNSHPIICSGPLNLPNLKKLYLRREDFDNFRQQLLHFQNCPILVDLVLANHNQTEIIPCSNLILPPSVQNLVTIGCIIDFEVNLQKVIIDGYKIKDIEEYLLPQVQATELVICGIPLFPAVEDFVRVFPLILQRYQRVYLSLESWDYYGWNNLLSPFVSTKSRCYVFENQVGSAISNEEFEQIKIEIGQI